ncbi:hypothetical protein BC629DRAFT_496645 [Irpex lacteus]|nr:hypothetical protein BC629DRAFT_496645 [Irpex lacteus]
MPPKRKSDARGPSTSKNLKARTSTTDIHPAATLVDSILANKQACTLPQGEASTRQTLVQLAEYAHALKLELAEAQTANATMVPALKKKTLEELEAAADKIRNAANSGICKQMSWKPSCKLGTAKFSYDGACADPEVFAIVLGLDGPPKWKMKKFAIADFEKRLGECVGKVRYDYLYITGTNVNVRYSDGAFKISGSYGISKFRPADADSDDE